MLKIKCWLACSILLGNSVSGFAMTPDETKVFFKEAFAHTVLNAQATRADYAKYFSKNFVMKMDGKTYHFDDYVQTMLALKKARTSIDINFKDMVAESGSIATAHVTHVVMRDGEEIYLNVLSLFKIQDHQFIDGNELTRLQS